MDVPLPRMRLLKEAAAEIKQLDPDTAVTTYFIRQLALEGKIKSVMAGRKRLINFDDLLNYLSLSQEQQPKEFHGIRKIV
ncbi:MAG: hypothetical protein LKJ17_09360 [Oscillospiraceae bacterium]|jgi:excisionase family DNA binding protein|nr:hypothetical protein [Oscillospiraceae bacterium]